MKTLILSLCTVALAACGSTRYGDPEKVETVNVDWGRTDLQNFASGMVDSLIGSPALAFYETPAKGEDKRVVLYMGAVRNETHEHINTEGITDSIRTALLNSGRFRLVTDRYGQDEIGERVRFDNGSGRVDPAQAKSFGKQTAADVILEGALRSIRKKTGRSFETLGSKSEDVYYQFVLNAIDIETGELKWSAEQEITKAQRTGIFGS